jgi:hypothetical protein
MLRSTVDAVDQPELSDIEARVEERPDLLDCHDQGDTVALAELMEHATGAKARSVATAAGA